MENRTIQGTGRPKIKLYKQQGEFGYRTWKWWLHE